MGGGGSKHGQQHRNQTGGHQHQQEPKRERYDFKSIKDRFETIEEVQEALRKAGLESSNLIIGVDFTISNTSAGKTTFNGQSLHSLSPHQLNPYQYAIKILGETLSVRHLHLPRRFCTFHFISPQSLRILQVFDDDGLIPAFGFGDKQTQDKSVFPFFPGTLFSLSLSCRTKCEGS
jgi:E3 ubiquitin-protein ligase RGLG